MLKTPQQRMEEYGEIRDEIWNLFKERGYYPQEIVGPLSNIIVELCVITSNRPLMDINRVCRTMTADVKNMVKSMKDDGNDGP
ncbi:MAG: hypothetical protein GXX87_03900 [Euryarchaeota archaeon]|jgi:hypothetical protein|nr:hypothetical protein [Euryarchaeota archaeon]